ncbi:MAG: response regulator [Chitinophagaceae bacterium]|nr:response regulator [Anaerolineae bacterium]
MDEDTTILSRPTILIVDDDWLNRELVEGLLNIAGYIVIQASSGKKALEFLNKQIPDAVIMDVRMPDMNGYELCKLLRKNERMFALPVVMVSAANSMDDIMQALDSGADDFISRDSLTQELAARINALLRRNRRASP